MARRPKSGYREERGEWFVTFRGVQHRLGSDKTEADRRFHEFMTKPEQTIVSGTVAEVLEHFMDWTEKNRPKSCTWYKKRIDHFYPKVRDLRTSDPCWFQGPSCKGAGGVMLQPESWGVSAKSPITKADSIS